MTNERAIELLHRLQDEQFDGQHGDERREALSMAVRALEGDGDAISRQAAIDAIERLEIPEDMCVFEILSHIELEIGTLPSAQPERTCVNCGRTANNGGWYADGRTRCPIEEHYALPKDGYCHLWEKRNVTDDDYPERREE